MIDFCQTHLHTEFSSLDGLSKVEEVPKRIKEFDQKYCAITDHGVMAGWIKFDQACKAYNIKPIFGLEFYYVDQYDPLENKYENKAIFENEDVKIFDRKKNFHLITLARNQQGYENICKLSSLSHQYGFYYKPRICLEYIEKYGAGIIATSACMSGIIPKLLYAYYNNQDEAFYQEALKYIDLYKRCFDDFYIEIQPLEMIEQVVVNELLLAAAYDTDTKIVAANDCHYIYPEDWESHEVLLAMQASYRNKTVKWNDPDRWKFTTKEIYIKSTDDMFNTFQAYHQNIDENIIKSAMENAIQIAEDCTAKPVYNFKLMPKVRVEDGFESLKKLCKIGFKKRGIFNYKNKDEYIKRLKHELKYIRQLNFVDYFLIIYDLVDWALNNDIIVGPGRGSSAGSLVCYLLNITQVDPIKNKLMFYRFIDPNRADNPDIDIDFADEKRDLVKQYLIDKYGENRVSSIGTDIYLKSKMALKDVSRIFDVPFVEANNVVDFIVEKPRGDERENKEIADSIEDGIKELVQFKNQYPHVINHSIKIEGLMKYYGIHACGVVITPENLEKYSGLRFDKKAGRVTQLDKDDLESMGILKVDLLGLNTLSIISEAIKLIDKDIDIFSLDFKDEEIFKLFSAGKTKGIFQFTSDGITKLCKEINISSFEELMAANALFRPGPLQSGQAELYPKIKRGDIPRSKLHPVYDRITKNTYGLMLYQEQIMEVVREVGGFDWKEVTAVRKIIGKSKGTSALNKFKKKFIKGAISGGLDGKNGMSEEQAKDLFAKMQFFGGWAFNRSHAACYSAISYYCMWLKHYYPLEFYTALLKKERDNDKKNIREIINEASELGIEFISPDINKSGKKWKIVDGKVVSGLIDIKGLGEKACDEIIEVQPFVDIWDFINKVNRRVIHKGVIKALVKAGAFKELHPNTLYFLSNLEKILKSEKNEKIISLLSESVYNLEEERRLQNSVIPVNSGDHVVEYYTKFINRFGKHVRIKSIKELESIQGFGIYIIGSVQEIKFKNYKKNGKNIKSCNLSVEDSTSIINVSMNGTVGCIDEGDVVLIKGKKIYNSDKFIGLETVNLHSLKTKLDKKYYKKLTLFERYLLKHPVKKYRTRLKEKKIKLIRGLKLQIANICGVVVDFYETETRKTGDWIAFARLEDESGSVELVLFSDMQRYKEIFKKSMKKLSPICVAVNRLNNSQDGGKNYTINTKYLNAVKALKSVIK